MVRQIQVSVPKYEGILSVAAMDALRGDSCVHNLQRYDGVDDILLVCDVVEKKTKKIVEKLQAQGIGRAGGHGTIRIMPVCTTIPRVATYRQPAAATRRRQYKLTDRICTEEIYAVVDAGIHLTFDYLLLIVIGAIIASVGLLTNSPTSVIAAMLVSPLMGPIVGMTFGTVVGDWALVRKSLKNEVVGVLLCLFVGGAIGLIIAPFIDESKDGAMTPGTEMSSRGTYGGLAAGMAIALASGFGVTIGVTGEHLNPLVGVAISAALLPPVVNAGLCVALGGSAYLHKWPVHVVSKHLEVGALSFCLFGVNWTLIYLCGLVMFLVKRVGPAKEPALPPESLVSPKKAIPEATSVCLQEGADFSSPLLSVSGLYSDAPKDRSPYPMKDLRRSPDGFMLNPPLSSGSAAQRSDL